MSKIFNNKNFLIVLLFILIGIIIYFNSLFNPFIWDDFSLICNNNLIRSFSNIATIFRVDLIYKAGISSESNFYRPMQALSYMLDYHFFGLSPFGYHLGNMLLHIINAILVYFLILMTTKQKPYAFIAGILFLVHPVHTEAVTYISGRADLLVSLFMLLSLIIFSIYQNYGRNKSAVLYIISLVCFSFALLSKELAIIFPAVLLLYDFCFKKEAFTNFKSFLKRHLAFILIDLVYIFLRLTLLNFELTHSTYLTGQYSFYSRLIIFFRAFNIYLRILSLPIDLHMGRVFLVSLRLADLINLLSMAFFLLIGILLLRSYKKQRIIFFSGFWFLIFLLPQSGLFYPINAFMAEHFIYLSSIGFFLIISVFLTKYCSPRILAIIMIILVNFYSVTTVIRNFEWRNQEVFYKKNIKESSYSLDSYVNLGIYYEDRGLFKEAIDNFENAIRLRPDAPLTRFYLADVYATANRYDESLKQLEILLNVFPGYREAEIYNNMGFIYQMKKSYSKAISYYQKAIDLKPDFYLPRCNLISIYNEQGLIGKSLKELSEILDIDLTLLFKDRKGPSVKELKSVLKNQKCLNICSELGMLFGQYKKFDIAEKIFKRTIELDFNNANSYFNLGVLYYQQGQKDKAEQQWRQALKINPRHFPSKEWLSRLQNK